MHYVRTFSIHVVCLLFTGALALVNAVSFPKIDIWRPSTGDADFMPQSEKTVNLAVNLMLALMCPIEHVQLKTLTLQSTFNPVKKAFLEKFIKTPKTEVQVKMVIAVQHLTKFDLICDES